MRFPGEAHPGPAHHVHQVRRAVDRVRHLKRRVAPTYNTQSDSIKKEWSKRNVGNINFSCAGASRSIGKSHTKQKSFNLVNFELSRQKDLHVILVFENPRIWILHIRIRRDPPVLEHWTVERHSQVISLSKGKLSFDQISCTRVDTEFFLHVFLQIPLRSKCCHHGSVFRDIVGFPILQMTQEPMTNLIPSGVPSNDLPKARFISTAKLRCSAKFTVLCTHNPSPLVNSKDNAKAKAFCLYFLHTFAMEDSTHYICTSNAKTRRWLQS